MFKTHSAPEKVDAIPLIGSDFKIEFTVQSTSFGF